MLFSVNTQEALEISYAGKLLFQNPPSTVFKWQLSTSVWKQDLFISIFKKYKIGDFLIIIIIWKWTPPIHTDMNPRVKITHCK